MAFSGNYMCTSFKQELLTGSHNFTNGTGDTFKLALYDNNASFDASTTDYTATNEVANSGTYSAGGGTLTNVTPTTSGTTAFTDYLYICNDHCSWGVDLQHHNRCRLWYNRHCNCFGLRL
jgi:hypothetical protein